MSFVFGQPGYKLLEVVPVKPIIEAFAAIFEPGYLRAVAVYAFLVG